MKVICYVGDKDTREKLRSKIKKNIDDISVIVTTYEVCELFSDIQEVPSSL